MRLLTSAILIASAGCGRMQPGHTPAASPSLACHTHGAATETDSGHTLCLTRSAPLEIYLHGSALNRWSPLRLDGGALRRAPSGKEMLALGVTGGFFVADHAGTARLTSARSCGRSAAPKDCGSPRTFEITVIVR